MWKSFLIYKKKSALKLRNKDNKNRCTNLLLRFKENKKEQLGLFAVVLLLNYVFLNTKASLHYVDLVFPQCYGITFFIRLGKIGYL